MIHYILFLCDLCFLQKPFVKRRNNELYLDPIFVRLRLEDAGLDDA